MWEESGKVGVIFIALVEQQGKRQKTAGTGISRHTHTQTKQDFPVTKSFLRGHGHTAAEGKVTLTHAHIF